MKMPKRKFGDRYDGYLIRKLDPIARLTPIFMRTRTDSQVFFEYKLDITELEKFIREHRKDDLPNLRLLHIIMAGAVRLMSQYPRINRFIAGKKLYARNSYDLSITCKSSLTKDADDTVITINFDPEDTLPDIVERVEKKLTEELYAEDGDSSNSTDGVAKVLSAVPTFVMSGFVGLMRSLDKIGLMPKAMHKASPFHTSIYITDLGSCGIDSVFHHLYEFGTCSMFVAMGKKESEYYIDASGETKLRRYINIRIVADERVCDGFYYASAMKAFTRMIRHPEKLLEPPEEVVFDDIGRKVKYKKNKKD